ncbi:hypothetical protein DL768_009336 [Monosporascus sp. mg162]|nr:hypothetical protein DL768_009336 [Monosporascus sp. mg162]
MEILERNSYAQPILDDSTTWEQLPQIELKDLGCVRVPRPRKYGQGDVALDDSLVINLDDLLSGKLRDKSVISSILESNEHIRTLSLVAQTRGLSEQLRTWAIKQEIDIDGFAGVEREDVGDRAWGSLARTAATLCRPSAASAAEDQAMRRLQESLRESHPTNFAHLLETSRPVSITPSSRHASIYSIMSRLNSSIVHSRSMSAEYNTFDETPNLNSDDETRKLLLTPGFVMPMAENSKFKGSCALCSKSDTVLALLLREPPSSVATPGFPLPQSRSKVAFPLAMGNFAETDILSFMCCDACASVRVKSQATVYGNRIIAALPLVPYNENKQAYETWLKVAFQDRFAHDDNALVFIAVLYVQILKPRAAFSENDKLFLRALKWACADLSRSVYSPSALSDSFPGPSFRRPLHEALSQSADDATKAKSVCFFQYPIEGFVIMTMILDSQKEVQRNLPFVVESLVFQRLLYHITEQYHQHLAVHGRMLTHLTMMQVLVQDRRQRSASSLRRGLGRLQRPRSISSFSFRGLSNLTRTLFGDHTRAMQPKLAVSVELLAETPLISTDTLLLLRKLGANFDWIDNRANNALAVFLHHLPRSGIEHSSPADHFKELAALRKLSKVFRDPADVSPHTAKNLVKLLPPLDQPLAHSARP